MANITRTVSSSTDDCRKYYTTTTAFSITLSVRVGHVNPTYKNFENGLRFENIAIAKDTVITGAKLILTASANLSTNNVNTRIYGQASDDPITFSDITDFSARSLTTAYVSWNSISSWSLDNEYDSPDIKTIIQEIVNRDGWTSGNDIVIMWKNYGTDSSSGVYRDAYSYDTGAEKAPQLYIEYESEAVGWSHKLYGVTPSKINGIATTNISKVNSIS